MEAGRRAERVKNIEETIRHFGRVVEAKGDTRDDTWAEAALAFGKAILHVGYADPAEEGKGFRFVEDVFEYYIATGRSHKSVEIMAGNLPSRLWIVDRLLALTERSLELVEPGTETEAYLLVRLGYALGYSSRQDYAAADRAFEAAESYANRTDNQEIRSRIFQSRILIESRQTNWETMTRYALRITSGPEDRTRNTKASGYQGAVNGLLTMGDLGAAKKLTIEAVELAERTREPEAIRTAAVNTHNVAVLTGDRHLMTTHHHYSNRIFTRSAWPRYRYALFELMLGDEQSALQELQGIRDDPGLSGLQIMDLARVKWTLARASHITLDPDWAKAANSIQWAKVDIPLNVARSWTLSDCLISRFTEDKYSAASAYNRVERFSGEADSGLWSHPCAIDGILALTALTLKQPAKAATHWSIGYNLCIEAGFLPDLYLILRDHAFWLMTETSKANILKAGELIDQANEVATKLEFNFETTGLTRLNEVYARATSRIGAMDRFGLSVREIEVLKLVSAGHSNRRIAEVLTISRYTAAEHVSNILRKTGTSNRAAAVKIAAIHGLI